MAQFGAYLNPNGESSAVAPLLLDVQSELLESLATRVVVPLCPLSKLEGPPIKTLMPVFEIEGGRYAMLTPQLAGIRRTSIGAFVADLSTQRADIMAALDLLVTGF